MIELLKKARYIYLSVFVIFALSYGAGYVAGSLKWVSYARLLDSRVIVLSRTLEYRVPGYGTLLRSYKTRHDQAMRTHLVNRDAWAMGKLIFLNNWIVTNLTMTIRAIFVLPVCLLVPGKFFQGTVFSQTPGAGRIIAAFVMEFGGYFLTICATLCLVFWTAFHRRFEFASRGAALLGGLKLIGLAYLVSAVGWPLEPGLRSISSWACSAGLDCAPVCRPIPVHGSIHVGGRCRRGSAGGRLSRPLARGS